MGEKPKIIVEAERPRITLERVFDAPRRQVFEAWTKAEHVKCWYSPGGFAVCDCDIDFRVNGKWRVVLRGPQGQEHGVSGEYREIEAPERLVQSFRYDGEPQAEAVETLVFSEKDGKTLLTSTVVHTSAENCDWHVKSGLQDGATQVLDRLADHLESGAVTTPGVGQAHESPDVAARKAKRVRQMAAAALAVVVLAGGGLYWSSHWDLAAHYVRETVARGSVIRTVSVNGTVNPVGVTPIKADAPGKIEAIYCDAGAKVKAGQLCAKIDARPYQSIVDREKAELAVALAQLGKDGARLARAKADLERNQHSAKRSARARSALDKSQAAYEQAQARATLDEAAIARGRAALQAAESNLAHVAIVSPIDGTVASRNIELGQTVGTSDEERAVFLVAPDLAAMQVDARVNAKDVGEIKLGDKASFTVDALPDRVYTGEVSQIRRSPPIDQDVTGQGVTGQGVTGQDVAGQDVVLINAPNPDLSLAPAMKATVQIVVDRRDNVIRVPNQSLHYSANRLDAGGRGGATPQSDTRLWLLRNGKPAAVTVQLGLDDSAYTEIVEGDLLPGDQLILAEDGGRSRR